LIIQNKIENDRQFAPLDFCGCFAQRNAALMSYTTRASRFPAAFVNLRRAAGGQRLQQPAIRIVNIIAPKNENQRMTKSEIVQIAEAGRF
jgi:hypothetical protein